MTSGIMAFIASSVILALSLSGAPAGEAATKPAPATRPIGDAALVLPVEPAAAPRPIEAWMIDAPERRPAALPALYATLGAMHALDAYSTRRAVNAGAYEGNPLMRKAAGNSGAMLAVKAASTAATIFFAERAWKKNRKGAVILMAAINGAMAAVSVRNFRNAQRPGR